MHCCNVVYSLSRAIKAKYRTAEQHRADLSSFREQVLAAVADGRLTDSEIDQLGEMKTALGLSSEEIRRFRVQAYELAFRTVISDGKVTKREEAEPNRI